VRRIAGRAIAEASGRITPATAPAIAGAGVDLISAGWLTHSAQVLDIGLDWQATRQTGLQQEPSLKARSAAA
jgi:nicotinate-nucleotide pyrophosphorylase (carboxylating)